MHIGLISQLFPPEVGACMNRVAGLCHYWRQAGHEVTVVTAYPNYPTGIVPPQYHWKLHVAEQLEDGTRVCRYWQFAAPTKGVGRRTLSHLSFAAAAFAGGLRDLRTCDVLVVTSPPVLQVISAMCLGWLLRKPWIYDMRDPMLQTAAQLEVVPQGLLYRRMRVMEKAFYRRCASVVVVARSFIELVAADGVSREKLVFIPNGADLPWIDSVPTDPQAVRQQLGVGDKFVVAYVGTHGVTQGVEYLAEAAQLVADRDEVHFLFVGGGCNKAHIQQWTRTHNLSNVQFLEPQPRERVIQIYAGVDLPVVCLRPHQFMHNFVPSKMFEVMGAGRPILGAVNGEAREILEQSGAAILCEPGNPESIAQGIMTALDNRDQLAEMGASGRRFVEEKYDRAVLAKRYEQLLTEAVNKGSKGGGWELWPTASPARSGRREIDP